MSNNDIFYSLMKEIQRISYDPAFRGFFKNIPNNMGFFGFICILIVIGGIAIKFLNSSFFKQFQSKAVRTPQKVKGMQKGDILQFAFLPQPQLSNKDFEIIEVNTYLYNGKHYPEFVLKDRNNNLFYMMIEKEDGEEFVAISAKYKRLNRTNVSSLIKMRSIDLSQFEDMIGDEINQFNPNASLSNQAAWLQFPLYKTGNKVQGAFADVDLRELHDSYQAEEFTSFIFEDNDGETALEFEMYDSNEVEACMTVYHDMSCIKEIWPAEQQ